MPSKTPIALFCSDLHLSEKPPIARAGELDWMKCQFEMLDFINKTAEKYHVRVYCSGDVFHRAKSTQKTEVLATLNMREWYCIPGQHDLPGHLYSNIWSSSYGVLSCASIHNLGQCGEKTITDDISVKGFPYGLGYDSPQEGLCDINIAMIHTLVWEGKPPFPGAPETGNVKSIAKQLKDYDVIVAGDNHEGFVTEIAGKLIINCGSTMRRSADQEFYHPAIYLLYEDLSVDVIEIPIKNDVFSTEHIEAKQDRDLRIESFVRKLKDDMGSVELSFEKNMEQFLLQNNIEESVVQLIKEAYCE